MIRTTFDEAYEKIQTLVSHFEEHKSVYLSPNYTEIEARQDFIDRFFTALGWDVSHEYQRNPYKQEVKVEKNVRAGHSQRRADYAFFLDPNYQDVKFYVEAKKPSLDIESKNSYFQTVRYGWNSQTPIAVLTDFEQFHVLDCRYVPDIDTALERGIKKFWYTDYKDKERFAEIYYLFSREAVADNSLESFSETLPKTRGKARQRGLFKGGFQSMDETFLEELDVHRDDLSRSLKNKNSQLDSVTLTEITQRILDRLVFLRFLEDKLIETRESVGNFGSKGTVWGDFIAASRRLDGIYNGIIFKQHHLIDAGKLEVDDVKFADICEELSGLNSPYDFNIIPIHILGSIYERFLGSTIVATAKRAKVEEKPEVRKAGGVYYTPEYIVRYIVENTVGKLIEGKTPAQIENMQFADISCGSGSFLIGIYDYLLKYHGEWYNRNPKKVKEGECVKHEDGTLHLSLSKKRKILLNNIYGVDIDPQAVEVAQLSLYLKLLEEETTASASTYQYEFHETLLPSLADNIKCGSSLIGSDFYENKPMNLFEPERWRKINAFDWETEFPEIMKEGGFDAIIGNPPYVILSPDIFSQDILDYVTLSFEVAQYKTDLFHLFIEKGISLLRKKALLGYIVPNPWLTLKFSVKLRKHILENTSISEIVIFDHFVFNDATVNTALLFLSRLYAAKEHLITIRRPNENIDVTDISSYVVSSELQSKWYKDKSYCFETRLVGNEGALINKLIRSFPKLQEVCRASLGCQAYNISKHTKQEIRDRVFHAPERLDNSYLPELAGSDVTRYRIHRKKGQWIKYGPWLHDYRTMDWLKGPRILIREIPGSPPYKIQAAYVEDIYCNYKTILNINPSPQTEFSVKYLVAL